MTNPSASPGPDSWADLPPATSSATNPAPAAGGGRSPGDTSGPPPGPGGPPPGGTGFPPPGSPLPGVPYRRRRRLNPAAAALAVVGAAAVSVGAGHYLWPAGGSGAATAAASPASGSGGSGSSALPFGGHSLGDGGGFFGDSPFSRSGSGATGSGGTSSSGVPAADVSAIAAKVAPDLVDINTTFGYQQASGAGTGIVLTSNGEILTNNHVINGATSISVTDIGNGKTYSASVVGYDSSADVAVLQLQGASGLQTAKLADSSTLKVGQAVVAVGNAGGTGGTPSSAGGSVTALGQAITAGDDLNGTSEQLSGLIQVDADIQAGDSGGSLVNTSGEVIGIDTAASSGYSLQSASNQGYAIPINTALGIAHQIEAGKPSSTVHVGPTAFLGVTISSGSSGGSGFGFGDSGSGYSDPGSATSGSGGATVSGVVPGGAAASAGLTAGDTITSVNGQSISSPTGLSAAISRDRPGDRIQLSWTDTAGQSHTATAVLGSGPPA